jgi:hypothetical protein
MDGRGTLVEGARGHDASSAKPLSYAEPSQGARVERTEVAADSVAFQLVDPEGKGLANGKVQLWRNDGLREAAHSKGGVAGMTGADGLLRLRVEGDVRNELSTYAVCATTPGHATAWLERIAPDALNVIVVPRGIDVTFRCRDREGKPVAGALVRMSATILDIKGPLENDRLSPLGPPVTCVHSAVSGEDGNAMISGLLPRHYHISIAHPFMVRFSRLQEGDGATFSATSELEVVLDEPWVAACAYSEDLTLYWRRMPRGLNYPPQSLLCADAIRWRIESEVRAKGLHGALTSIGFSRDLQSAGNGREQELVSIAYFPHRGWCIAAVPYKKARQAELVVLTGAAASRCEHCSVTATVTGPDGSPSVLPRLVLVLRQLPEQGLPAAASHKLKLPLPMPVELGESKQLPAGEYEVQMDANVYGADCEGLARRQVGANESVNFSVRERKRLVRFTLDAYSEEGVEIGFLTVVVRGPEQEWTWQRAEGLNSCYLPVGDYVAEVHAMGFVTQTIAVVAAEVAPFEVTKSIVFRRQ